MKIVERVPIRVYPDERGTLRVIEEGTGDLPWSIYRVFWLDECSQPRGGTHTNHCGYFLIPLRGSFTVLTMKAATMGPGGSPAADPQKMDNPSEGLLIAPHYCVKIIDWSDDALCLVLTEGPYDGKTR